MIRLLLLFLLCQFVSLEEVKLQCCSSESEDTCPDGTFFRANAKINGTCPGCVPGGVDKAPCEVHLDCQPGFTCDGTNCTKDTDQLCATTKAAATATWKFWKPSCEIDGKFSPKQCKGERLTGRCFCVDSEGKRIFGEAKWNDADRMNCACSRHVSEAENTGKPVSLHCDAMGNYELLQCENELCWCADDLTGIPYSMSVPKEMVAILPCHDSKTFGIQYFRQCDSIKAMQYKLQTLFHQHNTTTYFTPVACNPDGSYARVQTVGPVQKCVHKDNSNNPEEESGAITEDVDCNCAYDKAVARENGLNFVLGCTANGNYLPTQTTSSGTYCVDKDGMPSSEINPNFKCTRKGI